MSFVALWINTPLFVVLLIISRDFFIISEFLSVSRGVLSSATRAHVAAVSLLDFMAYSAALMKVSAELSRKSLKFPLYPIYCMNIERYTASASSPYFSGRVSFNFFMRSSRLLTKSV